MKIIDWTAKGNVVRFILGDDGCTNYWGDDWNDAPYEHNAGDVYEEFIKGYCDISFPFDYKIYEPCNNECNSNYSKEDMKKRIIPCLVVVPDFADNECDSFAKTLGNEKAVKFYFGDNLTPTRLKV